MFCFEQDTGKGEYWVDPNEDTYQVNMFVQAILQGVLFSYWGVSFYRKRISVPVYQYLYHFTENKTKQTWVYHFIVYHFAEYKMFEKSLYHFSVWSF